MRDIPGYEGLYAITESGDVWSHRRNIFLKPRKTTHGYVKYALSGKEHMGHRLVAKAFIPNEKEYPVVNHLDGDKQNNHVNNLEWCTVSHNLKHAFATGLKIPAKGTGVKGEQHRNSKLTEQDVRDIRTWINKGYTQAKIAKAYVVTRQVIWGIYHGKSWKHI
jgi:hypothetical protein